MNVRPFARVCGLLGGACWVVRAVLGDSSLGGGSVGDALQWTGLLLLFVGLFGLGTLFVSKGAVWLQVIVGVAFPLLVWSVVEVINGAGDPLIINAVVGFVVAAAGVIARGSRDDGDERPSRRHAGAHAR